MPPLADAEAAPVAAEAEAAAEEPPAAPAPPPEEEGEEIDLKHFPADKVVDGDVTVWYDEGADAEGGEEGAGEGEEEARRRWRTRQGGVRDAYKMLVAFRKEGQADELIAVTNDDEWRWGVHLEEAQQPPVLEEFSYEPADELDVSSLPLANLVFLPTPREAGVLPSLDHIVMLPVRDAEGRLNANALGVAFAALNRFEHGRAVRCPSVSA